MYKSAALLLTERCNASCSHCGSPPPQYKRPEPDRASLLKLYPQFISIGVKDVLLSGGEPLLRRDLLPIIRDMGTFGLRCALFTNGTLLTERQVTRLGRLDNILFLRLSLEYPDRVLNRKGRQGRYHPTGEVLDKVRLIAASGITAGVNVTLFPDSLRYAEELTASAVDAGASFIRFAPVLPGGDAASLQLDDSFFTGCLGTVLKVHERFGQSGNHASNTAAVSLKRFGATFCSGCRGGTDTMTITPDGSVHICPMTDFGGKEVNIHRQPLRECLKILTRRRAYLQRRVVEDGICRDCSLRDQCRGGCLAEWAVRGRPAGQPVCWLRHWKEAGKKRLSAPEQAVVHRQVEFIREFSRNGGSLACVRAHPFWTVVF